MELTYLGVSCVRLRGRDTQVIIDPVQAVLPGMGTGMGKGHADIVVTTEGGTDTEALRAHEGHPQIVGGAGEFEVRGVSIHGLSAGEGTIVRVEVDDVRVAHLGRLQRQLTEEEVDALGHLDVLVIPVGGGDALDAHAAAKVVRALEPAIVVPVRFRGTGPGEYEPLERFAAEMGAPENTWQPQPKLNLTGSSGSSDETRVVVLENRG